MNSSLLHTERKLIAIFLGGAFLFLLIFEGFFLVSRFIFEESISRSGFATEMKRMENHSPDPGRRPKDMWPRVWMTILSIDKSWTILDERGGEETPLYEEIITGDFLDDLETGVVVKKDDILVYKRVRPENPELYQLFIRKSGYPLEDILRDILRFLVLDILIILPFYFMGRYFVRKTLEPVEENIDSMSHFIHNAWHELKTPLAIVSGNLQILRESTKWEQELIGESIDTIHAMSDSLDGLLELSSVKKSWKTDSIQLYDAFQGELEKEKALIEQKNLTYTIHIPKESTIKMDTKHFSLLFGNLIRNAIIYNKKGGEIFISQKDNTITIRDTGIGINEKNLKKIWERFFREDKSGKNPGTGIGLSIVEKIIELYGWKIWVQSVEGNWTTFTITIK